MEGWSCEGCAGQNPHVFKFCGHCGRTRPTGARTPAAPTGETVLGAEGMELAESVVHRITEVGAAAIDERRWVTALFADISGFTALAEQLSPEELLQVVEPVLSRVREIVNRYEGYVAKYLGDAILAFFGAPLAHEDDAARALLVALEIKRDFARLLPTLPPAAMGLELHIGVNSGHVVSGFAGQDLRVEAYSILGDSVNMAQRLEAAAPRGEIYVGETTRELTEEMFDFELVGDLEMKGKARPVRAWKLVSQKNPNERLRPARAGTRMVGRELELDACRRAFDLLGEGTGGITALVAEAGMGKSTLLRELRQDAGVRGFTFLEARCVSYGNELAYWPFIDLVRNLYGLRPEDPEDVSLRHLTESLTARGLAETVDFFAVLVGVKRPEETGVEPEAVRRRVHESLALALRQRASSGPVVLVIEDMHWIDEASQALTLELARSCRDAPVHLVLTGRPEAWPQIEAVADHSPAERRTLVSLGSLDEDSLGALLRQVLGGPVTLMLPAFFHQRTLGNPYFTEELARSMRESEQLVFRDGAWQLAGTADTLSLPPTVEGVITTRLDRLPRADLGLLQVAAVVGRRPRLALLKAAGADVENIDEGLARLVQTNFLAPAEDDPSEFLTFSHGLLHQVTYSRMLRRYRRDAHRRVADAALKLYGDGDDFIDLTAHHLYLAEAGAEAFRALSRAASKSRRLFANDEAIVHLQHALEVAGGVAELDQEIGPTLLQLGRLQERVGTYDRALDSYRQVRDRTGQVESWQGMASVLRKRGEGEEALELLEVALGHARETGQDVRALWLERAWCLGALKSRYDDTVAALQTALQADPGRGDAVEGYLVVQLARVEAMTGRLEDALDHVAQAQAIFQSLEDLPGQATALQFRGGIENQLGDAAIAVDTLRRGLAIAERVGAPEDVGGCLINLGYAELDCGNLEQAVACNRRAVAELERIGRHSRLAIAHANLAETLVRLGDFGGALDHSDQAIAVAESVDSTFTLADALMVRASLNGRGVDAARAEEDAARAAELFASIGLPDRQADALDCLAEILRGADDNARAAECDARALSLRTDLL